MHKLFLSFSLFLSLSLSFSLPPYLSLSPYTRASTAGPDLAGERCSIVGPAPSSPILFSLQDQIYGSLFGTLPAPLYSAARDPKPQYG